MQDIYAKRLHPRNWGWWFFLLNIYIKNINFQKKFMFGTKNEEKPYFFTVLYYRIKFRRYSMKNFKRTLCLLSWRWYVCCPVWHISSAQLKQACQMLHKAKHHTCYFYLHGNIRKRVYQKWHIWFYAGYSRKNDIRGNVDTLMMRLIVLWQSIFMTKTIMWHKALR